jgi:hypothetical protein
MLDQAPEGSAFDFMRPMGATGDEMENWPTSQRPGHQTTECSVIQ